jgi:hypothetical protein
MLLQENAAYRLQICLEAKIFPEIRTTILAKKTNVWKDAIHSLMKLSLPLISLV